MKEVFSMINRVGMEGRDKSMLMKTVPTGPKSQYWQQSITNNNGKHYKDTMTSSSSEECITVPVVRSVLYKNSNGDNIKSTTTEWVTVNKKNSVPLSANEDSSQSSSKGYMTRSESSPIIARQNITRGTNNNISNDNIPVYREARSGSFDHNHNSSSESSNNIDDRYSVAMRQTVSNTSIKSILKKSSTSSEKTTVNNVVISPVPQSKIVPRFDPVEDKQLVTAKILSSYGPNIRQLPERTIVSPRSSITRSVSDNNNTVHSRQPFTDYSDAITSETIQKLLRKPPILPKPDTRNPTSYQKFNSEICAPPRRHHQQHLDSNRSSRPIARKELFKQPSPSKSPAKSDSIFSPTYTKVLSEKEMSAREAWAETQRRKAKMREEFFKLPYEEVNWEIVNGRRSHSEPRKKTHTLRNYPPTACGGAQESHYSNYKNRDISPEISRASALNRSLPPSQRINLNKTKNTQNYPQHYNDNSYQERGRRIQKFSPIKEMSDKTKLTSSPKYYNANLSSINNNNVSTRSMQNNNNNNNNFTSVNPNINIKENLNERKKTPTNVNEKTNTVDIAMRKGPSFSNHHLQLKSISNPNGGTVTVKRYKVPQISFQEKWEWIQKYAPEALGPLHRDYEDNFNDMNVTNNTRCKTPPNNPPMSPKSPTSPILLTTPSPTPSLAGSSCCMSSASSSSSSGCYSGSCSPTPPPSRLVKAGVPPTRL